MHVLRVSAFRNPSSLSRIKCIIDKQYCLSIVLFIQSNGNSQFSINVLKYNILTDVSSSNVVRILTRELQGDFGNSSHVRDNKKYYKKGDYCHKRKTIQKTNDYKTKASKGYSPKAICSNHFFGQDIM